MNAQQLNSTYFKWHGCPYVNLHSCSSTCYNLHLKHKYFTQLKKKLTLHLKINIFLLEGYADTSSPTVSLLFVCIWDLLTGLYNIQLSCKLWEVIKFIIPLLSTSVMSHHWHPSETAQNSTGKMLQMKELQYITLKIYWQWECVTSHILASSEQSNTLLLVIFRIIKINCFKK